MGDTCSTQGVLAAHHHKFCGVLNGLDYECWSPESDWQLAAHYSAGGCGLRRGGCVVTKAAASWAAVSLARPPQLPQLPPLPSLPLLPPLHPCHRPTHPPSAAPPPSHPSHCPADTPHLKEGCKRALLQELGLPYEPPGAGKEPAEGPPSDNPPAEAPPANGPPSRPLLAVVSRLTQQKGLPLILRGIQVALERGAQVGRGVGCRAVPPGCDESRRCGPGLRAGAAGCAEPPRCWQPCVRFTATAGALPTAGCGAGQRLRKGGGGAV